MEKGIVISKPVSMGNQADITASDYLEYLGYDEFIKNNYWPLLLISLPVLILIEILYMVMMKMILLKVLIYNTGLFSLIDWIFNVITTGFYYALLIFVLNSIYSKTPFTIQNINVYLKKNIISVSLALVIINIVTQIGIILLSRTIK